MRIFFKFTNDNNPFKRAEIRPATYMDGLSKVGGYFVILTGLNVALFLFNSRAFENTLVTKFRSQLEETMRRQQEIEMMPPGER